METMKKHRVAMAQVGVCSREMEAESPAAIAPPKTMKQEERIYFFLDYYCQYLCMSYEHGASSLKI